MRIMRTRPGWRTFLRERGVDEVYLVGLATDYCVKFTALDAVGSGSGLAWSKTDAGA